MIDEDEYRVECSITVDALKPREWHQLHFATQSWPRVDRRWPIRLFPPLHDAMVRARPRPGPHVANDTRDCDVLSLVGDLLIAGTTRQNQNCLNQLDRQGQQVNLFTGPFPPATSSRCSAVLFAPDIEWYGHHGTDLTRHRVTAGLDHSPMTPDRCRFAISSPSDVPLSGALASAKACSFLPV